MWLWWLLSKPAESRRVVRTKLEDLIFEPLNRVTNGCKTFRNESAIPCNGLEKFRALFQLLILSQYNGMFHIRAKHPRMIFRNFIYVDR